MTPEEIEDLTSLYKEAFLEELRVFPNFRAACESLNIDIRIFYSWKRVDLEFWDKVLMNLELGRAWSNASVEQKLFDLAMNGNISAIKQWQAYNDPRYRQKPLNIEGFDAPNTTIDPLGTVYRWREGRRKKTKDKVTSK